MEYFRRYLIYVRKTENLSQTKIPFAWIMFLVGIGGMILGLILDAFLPFSYIPNTIRGIIALTVGVSMFTFSYLKAVERGRINLSRDRYYKSVRERFSNRQRINISIVLGGILGAYVLITSSESLTYTINSSAAVFAILVLISFARKRRSEFIKDVYEIPDIRDMEHNLKVKNKKETKKNDK